MSNESIERLRSDLDSLDRLLLETAARRGELVRRIAAAKSGTAPLFDRGREREVHARAAEAAATLDLPQAVARHLIQAVVEHSHAIQEEASAVRAQAAAPRRFLIVGGAGRMGRLLGGALAARGHEIDVLEPGDERPRTGLLGAAEITVVAVPMDVAAAVCAELGPLVRSDALLCDINSLKEPVCRAMAETCRGEAVGLHPMFGPTVRSLRRQKVIVCPVREGPLAGWLRGELEAMGLELIDSDPGRHDRLMAVIQVLVHFSTLVMGQALRGSGIPLEESLRHTSPIYRLELAFVGRLFAQSPDLYAEILMANPHGAGARRLFRAAAEDLDGILGAGDREAFTERFESAADYFRQFSGEAMQLSDSIIEMLVRQP